MKIMLRSNINKKYLLLLVLSSIAYISNAAYILIPMDNSQNNHLKAYGIAYLSLELDIKVDWLLNYQGGSFMIKYNDHLLSLIHI